MTKSWAVYCLHQFDDVLTTRIKVIEAKDWQEALNKHPKIDKLPPDHTLEQLKEYFWNQHTLIDVVEVPLNLDEIRLHIIRVFVCDPTMTVNKLADRLGRSPEYIQQVIGS